MPRLLNHPSRRSGRRLGRVVLLALGLLAGSASAQTAPTGQAGPPADVIVAIFDEAAIELDKTIIDGTAVNGYTVYAKGCAIEKTVDLPQGPKNQRDAQRIIATVIVDPVITKKDGKIVPGDPWTRLGSLRLILPPDDALDNPEAPATRPANAGKSRSEQPGGKGRKPPSNAVVPPSSLDNRELELMRFITPFGGPMTFTQDVTSLAPYLHGRQTFRLTLGTIGKPAWKVTVMLKYGVEGVGYRRPVWAKFIATEDELTTDENKIKVKVEVPPNLARPRLRIISTGHATDGTGGDEFVSRTHVLRIDGGEVARWRPWAEDGGPLRAANPMSGREPIQGRDLWSSDLDRSGWMPGRVVEPLIIPVPELSPGRVHTVELEILGIRPKDQLTNHGFWRVSMIAVADEPWPDDDGGRP